MISGFGRLVADGTDLGDVEYKIHDAPPVAHGTMWATGDVLGTAFDAKKLTLRRQDNSYVMTIYLKALAEPGVASITVTGSPNP